MSLAHQTNGEWSEEGVEALLYFRALRRLQIPIIMLASIVAIAIAVRM